METDAENNRTELDYDAVGQIEEIRRFDASGELISKSRFEYNPLGQVRFRYDVSAEDDSKQRVTEFIYDSAGRLKEIVGPDVPSGTIRLHEEFVYDAASRVVDRYRWRDETGQSKARTHFTYDDLGRVRSVTDPDNSTVWFGYNEAGMKTLELRSTKPVSISDLDTYNVDDPQLTHAREFRYNVKGELTRQLIQDVAGSPGATTYPDAAYPNRHYKAIAYDYYGNGLLKSVTDPRGNQFLLEYDALGRKRKYKVTPPGGTEITYLEFRYAESNLPEYASMITRLDFPSGTGSSQTAKMATRFHLDGRGNIRLMEEGEFATNTFTALRSTTNTYYLNDQSQTSTTANITTSRTWRNDRLATVTSGTLPEYLWDYTEFGETEFITDTRTQKRVSFLYDENGGLAHESGYPSPGAGGLGVVPSVSYTRYPGDLMLQVATFAHRELQSDYALTPGGSLDFVGVKPTAAPWKFPYVVDQRNVLGQPIAVDLARGERYNLYRWNEYDNGTGKQKEQWLFTDLDEWELYFDAVDLASYDQLDRLKNYQSDFLDSDKAYTYSEPFGFLTGDSTATYTYDDLGNRLTRTAGTKTETYDYNDNVSGNKDPLNRLQSVTTINGSTISEKRLYIVYDGRGNLDAQEIRNGQNSLIKSFDYVWDDAGRLTDVIINPIISSRTRVRYGYDALDRRILREVYAEVGGTWGDPISETHTIYAGDSPIAEVDGVGNVVKEMVWDPTRSGGIGGLLLLRVRDDYGDWHEYRPIYDFRGNVLAMVDEDGLIVERYEYDAFGRIRILEVSDAGVETLVAESGIGNTYLFSTKCLDPEIGLYYFGARYYDPFQGRFISPDPLLFIDGPNRYAYVGNNPIGFIDPYGLSGVEGNGSRFAAELLSGYFGDDVIIQPQVYLKPGQTGGEYLAEGVIKGTFYLTPGVGESFDIAIIFNPTQPWGNRLAASGSLLLSAATGTLAPNFGALRAAGRFDAAKSGGRLGSQSTRQHVADVATEMESRGWNIAGGGGRFPEEYLPGPGGARKGSSFPDITATKDGNTLRVNTVDMYADGVTPTTREAGNATRIRSQTGEHLLLVPKRNQ